MCSPLLLALHKHMYLLYTHMLERNNFLPKLQLFFLLDFGVFIWLFGGPLTQLTL